MISSIEMIKRYDIISENYEERYYAGKDVANEIITKIIKEVVKEYAIQSAVEFGCGTGYWIGVLDQTGIKYILGIDGSEKMLKIAMKKDFNNKVCFWLDNITRIRRIERKFDLALTCFFISLLEERDFLIFIQLLCNSIRKGGIYLYIDNKILKGIKEDSYELVLKENWGGRCIDCYYRLYDMEKIKLFLEKFGFVCKKIIDISEDIYGIVFQYCK